MGGRTGVGFEQQELDDFCMPASRRHCEAGFAPAGSVIQVSWTRLKEYLDSTKMAVHGGREWKLPLVAIFQSLSSVPPSFSSRLIVASRASLAAHKSGVSITGKSSVRSLDSRSCFTVKFCKCIRRDLPDSRGRSHKCRAPCDLQIGHGEPPNRRRTTCRSWLDQWRRDRQWKGPQRPMTPMSRPTGSMKSGSEDERHSKARIRVLS